MALYAFDGTWQDADDQDVEDRTNVKRFYDLYDGATHLSDGDNAYVSGPGTRFGVLGRALGGAFGVGTNQRVDVAYKKLRKAFASGDRIIDIVGFSRGAATACAFCWLLNSNRTRRTLGQVPEIRFLGLWDTVFYIMGMTDLPLKEQLRVQWGERRFWRTLFFQKPGATDLRLPDIVKNNFHALALHEKRVPFEPKRLVGANEVWFVGEHSDIGGGSRNTHLSDTTLRWMCSKAHSCDLPIRVDDTRSAPNPDPFQSKNGILLRSREVRPDDSIHVSAVNFTEELPDGYPDQYRVDGD